MRTYLVLTVLLLLSSVVLADTAPPPSSRVVPGGGVSQLWKGRISLDAVKLLPRTTRTVPAGEIYWGSISDEKSWRAIVGKDPRALGGLPPVDFAKETIAFVLQDTIGGGGSIEVKGIERDAASGVVRVTMGIMPATLDIAFTSETVLLLRVPRGQSLELVANGVVLR